VDYYAGWAILVCDSSAVEPVADAVAQLLAEVTPLSGVLLRRRHSAEGERLTLLSGVQPPATLTVEENGLLMRADLRVGQKTGLFLDHRENRAFLEGRSKGLRVLNLFGYSGAFLLYALRGGASHVVNVDAAPGAAEDARENLRLNGFDPAQHEFVVADVFEYLERARQERTSFDLVICDPPSFARNQAHLDKALNAYCRVNGAALKVCVDGGSFAAASCTSRVTPVLFKQCLANAARRAQRRLQAVYESGQPADHPELIGHPESRYLKFVLCRVLARP
jgi:23S rRNA (cytosine1962-C5)-methyltransferase